MERADFSVEERIQIAEAVEERERKEAKVRRIESGKLHGRGQIGGAKFAPSMDNKTTVRTARTVGMSRPTYERAKAVVAAAKEEPERFGGLLGVDFIGETRYSCRSVR